MTMRKATMRWRSDRLGRFFHASRTLYVNIGRKILSAFKTETLELNSRIFTYKYIPKIVLINRFIFNRRLDSVFV